jgi:hypothetical protein
MPIRNALWNVGNAPQALPEARPANERVLERMIVAAPRILCDEWVLIGQQEGTGISGAPPAGVRELEGTNES